MLGDARSISWIYTSRSATSTSVGARSLFSKAVQVTYKTGRRIVIAVVGSSVLVLGIVMLITPGPAFIVIPIGLAILAMEFVWARRWLKKLREMISRRNASSHAERAENHRQL